MSRESHRRYLERAALREAQKAIGRKGRENFREDDLRHLRIQTVEPWKRIALGLLGLALSGASIVAFLQEPSWPGYAIAVLAIGLLLLALFGRKQSIDATLDGIDIVAIATSLLDGH